MSFILGLKLRGLVEEEPKQYNTVEDKLDKNLDQMVTSISTLKGLARGLGEEIITQNELIDNITYKAEKADITLHKQSKEMDRMLKKK